MIRNRCLLLSMVLLGVCLFMPQKSQAQSTIACNSDDMRRHSCAVDTRGGVQLVRQNSQSPCTEGRSWGTDSQGIWVDDGCRADFAVGERRDYRDQNRNERNQQYGGNGPVQVFACNSDDMGRHSCAVDTRGGVRLLTQHSEAPCTEGRNWGTDNDGIWVDHGCRADFSVGGNRDFRDERRNENRNDPIVANPNYQDEHHNDQYGGNRQQQRFACNSDNMRRHSCYIDTHGGEVRLVRQLSDSACTKGYSWGTNRRGIWVDHGCRADFAVVTAGYHGDSLR
jgi:Protein of unknown function (DUF3011)